MRVVTIKFSIYGITRLRTISICASFTTFYNVLNYDTILNPQSKLRHTYDWYNQGKENEIESLNTRKVRNTNMKNGFIFTYVKHGVNTYENKMMVLK